MQFAEFLYGTFDEVKRRSEKLGSSWAKAYDASATFPTPSGREANSGDLVVTTELNDLERKTPRWRLFSVDLLRQSINQARGWKDHEQVSRDLEQQTRTTPWGALSASISHVFPNSIPVEATRVRALLRFWDPLFALRYLGQGPAKVIGLEELVAQTYSGLLETWGSAAGGDVRERLARAVDAMTAASSDRVRDVISARLAELASRDPRLGAKPALKRPEHLRPLLDSLDEPVRSDLESGYTSSLRGALYSWLRG